jgi:hypothetical protein
MHHVILLVSHDIVMKWTSLVKGHEFVISQSHIY